MEKCLCRVEERRKLVHKVRSGQSVAQAARELGFSRSWGSKWWRRYCEEGWEGLLDRSRRPKRHPRQLPAEVHQAIRRIRSELEAEAEQPDHLGYIGAPAIRARLQKGGIRPLPSLSSIERELQRAGMTRPRKAQAKEIVYPHLHPTHPHELIQADILPKYLTGGTAVACFNAIDVVSRYPSGRQYERRTAQNACDFLISVWQEQGLPQYQQVDNEGCFSGGYTHPYVLGKVVRLALYVGVELVFSPFDHPQSNGFVERFHQDYADFVWQKGQLPDLAAVRQRSALFYRTYRTSRHHSQLEGHSPLEVHHMTEKRLLPADFRVPEHLPLTAGRVHFIRATDAQRRVRVLNHEWDVPAAQPYQGVWVTLTLSPKGAFLTIFDAAPDAPQRKVLAKHPFPIQEEVVPLGEAFRPQVPSRLPNLRGLLRRLLAPLLRPFTMS